MKSVMSDENKTDKENNVQIFSKQMLQSRLFIGTFVEKRYVESIKSYRTVVSVSSEETDLIKDIEVVKKRLEGYYNDGCWIGITSPNTIGAPAGFSIWTELSDEVFGSYWYKIKAVKFRSNEVFLRLKVIRPVCRSQTNNDLSIVNNSNFDSENSNVSIDSLSASYRELNISSKNVKEFLCSNTLRFMEIFTFHNMKETIIFLTALAVAIFTGSIEMINFLGDFIIKLLREVSIFIKAITPIVIACINLVGKSIGGLVFLFTALFSRNTTVSRLVPQEFDLVRYPRLTYDNVDVFKNQFKPRRYGPPLTITRLD